MSTPGMTLQSLFHAESGGILNITPHRDLVVNVFTGASAPQSQLDKFDRIVQGVNFDM